MSRKTWALIGIGIHVLVAAEIGPCEAGAAEPNPIVAIRLENPNGLAAPSLVRAQELATEIYERAGVTLRWNIDETPHPDRMLTVVLTTSAAAPPGLAADAMGVALSPGDGTRGTTAYVFIDRVTSFSAARRVAAQFVLACALAHEIGHLLLPPNAHRPDSVMRGSWHPALFPPKATGVPGFPPEQGRLLRLRARGR
jgi:hypothetical protein